MKIGFKSFDKVGYIFKAALLADLPNAFFRSNQLLRRYPALAVCRKELEAATLALLTCGNGSSGGVLRELADICIQVPEGKTYKVQELHLPVHHYLCAAVEAHFFVE